MQLAPRFFPMSHHSKKIKICFHGAPTAITVDFEVDGHEIMIEGASNEAGDEIALSREEEQEAADILYQSEQDRRADAADNYRDILREQDYERSADYRNGLVESWAQQDRDEGREPNEGP